MTKFLVFVILAATVISAVLASYYDNAQKKINIYVKKQEPQYKKIIYERPEYDYEQPEYKKFIEYKKEPELKLIKEVEYKKPEDKKVYVQVVKQEEQKYILKPDYSYKH